MTRDDIRTAVLSALGSVAPEADLSRLAPGADLRETLDIDSMDFLNFAIALHGTLGVEIPERDYPQLTTLAGSIDYLARALGVSG